MHSLGNECHTRTREQETSKAYLILAPLSPLPRRALPQGCCADITGIGSYRGVAHLFKENGGTPGSDTVATTPPLTRRGVLISDT